MSDDSVIVDIRVPDTIDLVLFETLKAANAIRDANRRREEQLKYQEAVKVEEPDDYPVEAIANDEPGPSTSTAEQNEIPENEDFISYAMRMIRTSAQDPNYDKQMAKKRLEFQEKNENKPIKANGFVKNSLADANREYEFEKKLRTDTHLRRCAAQKYFSDKTRTQTVFDESLMHNLKNPIIASVYHGNCEAFFGYISNCPQSGMRMPDRSKCLCFTSFSQAGDNAILLALSSHFHQKQCDGNGDCGRVSCRNGNDYLEIIRRLFEGTNRNYHIKEIVSSWMVSCPAYALLCPLSYCLCEGFLDVFEMMIKLIKNAEFALQDYRLALTRSRSYGDLAEEAIIHGLTSHVEAFYSNWSEALMRVNFERVCQSGRLDAVMSIMNRHRNNERLMKDLRKMTFTQDQPKYLDIILKPTANNDMVSFFSQACLQGAENCLRTMQSNEFWMAEIFNPEKCKYRTGMFEVLLRVSRICDRELFNPVKEFVLHSQEFSNFPFSCNVPDLLFHLACSRSWREFTEWLKRLDATKKNNQKYAKAQEYLNLSFRYFVFSTHFPQRVLRVILETLISAGAYVQTDDYDYALLNELQRKDFWDFLKYKESSNTRFVVDLENEMSKLTVNENPHHGTRRTEGVTPCAPGMPRLKRPRLC
ncbi:unnamed protein product [Auanema sp. JU1783]|nr:unnamed protein product [Auanema sp. JU1783]